MSGLGVRLGEAGRSRSAPGVFCLARPRPATGILWGGASQDGSGIFGASSSSRAVAPLAAPSCCSGFASGFLSGPRRIFFFGKSFCWELSQKHRTAPGRFLEPFPWEQKALEALPAQPEEMVWCCPNIPSREINLDRRSDERSPNFGNELHFSLTTTQFPWELPQPLPAELPQSRVFSPQSEP